MALGVTMTDIAIGDNIQVHYRGTLAADGSQFDASEFRKRYLTQRKILL